MVFGHALEVGDLFLAAGFVAGHHILKAHLALGCLGLGLPDAGLLLALLARLVRARAAIAAALGITAGTLTSAVNLLEKKGYLLRRRDERDKRVVHLLPTERGRAADARHRDFHRQMVAHVLDGLTDEEAECTLRALGRVAEFFRRGAPERG